MASSRKRGYSFVTAQNRIQALKQLENNNVDVIVTDMMMPEMDGMGLIDVVEKTTLYTC